MIPQLFGLCLSHYTNSAIPALHLRKSVRKNSVMSICLHLNLASYELPEWVNVLTSMYIQIDVMYSPPPKRCDGSNTYAIF